MGNDRDDHAITEILDRARRIETRITKLVESMGVDSGARKPTWNHGAVHVPSLETSLKDILAVVPPSWTESFGIVHKDRSIGRYYVCG